MIKDEFNGFCMALADSVPGVSGGTVAFIMGFYDKFVGAIHDLAFGKMEEKKTAVKYLARLGIGWAVGMAMAAFLLSALFESHIYYASSLFFGFVFVSIPIVMEEELECLHKMPQGFAFSIIGAVVVVSITMANGMSGRFAMDLGQFSILMAVRLFFIGMIAISAMFLPGISGSTLLLIFGAYMPVITAIKGVLSMDFSYIPCLVFFGSGVLAGSVTVVKVIRACLDKFRSQTVYLILGMMAGSLYAIGMGPTTLEVPQAPLNIDNFQPFAAFVGIIIMLGMQKIKEIQTVKEDPEL